MATIIVVANRKGGSGKTTSSINIADGLARDGKRVLLVDADSQAQATIGCGIIPYQLESSIYELLHLIAAGLSVKEELKSTIIKGQKHFDLLPARADLSALEIEVAEIDNRHVLMKDLLMELDYLYDYILIDLPPALGLISVNSLVAARWLIIPVEPTFLSMDGLAQMVQILYRVNAELNPDLRLLGILPVKCDLRTNLAKSVLDEIKQNFGEDKLLPPIRNDIKLAEAPSFGQSIFEYSAGCRGAMDYGTLVTSILTRSGE
ncbi:ParA family protein [Syntrophomonas palmitatica]|uniref:ParA family protein n=1 Tax=Syntrophomonas palmitatica TaxID=402877 RepID=UPI0006D22311|nr:ParA family protein [Syntrophomonas palmitatica]